MAITKEQLEIYRKYGGDENGLSRIGTASEKALMNGVKWERITDLIQCLSLASSGLASEEFKAATERNVEDSCRDSEAASLLRDLARPVSSSSSK